MALETRTDMEAVINAGGVVLFNGKRYSTTASLPTQDEIDAVYATGSAGESAYQAALDIGFVGTKAEWLASLVGATGATGAKGDTGDQGPAGEGSGNVNGPVGAVNNNIAVFDGTTGTLIKDGGATIASKQDALGFTPVTNARTVNSKQLNANITLDTDDLSDSGKTNKFVTAAEKTKLSNLSGTNTGDQDLSSYATTSALSAAVAGVAVLKGDTDASGNPNYPAATKGDLYYVTVAGKIGGASGKSVDVGDTYIAKANNAGGTEASVGTSWFVLEHNLVGALVAANNLSDVANAGTARTNLGLGTLATQSGTFSGTSSGTNTGDQTISDATISTTDITTNNVSTSKHGFAPKGDGTTTKFLNANGAYSTPAAPSPIIYKATTPATLVSSTTETSLLASPSYSAGSLTLAAGALSVGSIIRITGVINAIKVTGTPTLTWRFKVGSSAVYSFASLPINTTENSGSFTLDLLATATTGLHASGQMIIALFSGTTSKTPVMFGNTAGTLDMGVSNAIDITGQWSASSASNYVALDYVAIEVI